MEKEPMISVIIASYNAIENLEAAIVSVLNQTYLNKEILVIDGASTDGTLNLLKKYNSQIRYISETDKGISDAFNKGVEMSIGDFVYFLGADDYLISDNVLSDVMDGVSSNDMIICGRIVRVSTDGKNELWIAPKSLKFRKSSLLFRMALPHQGLFLNKKYFELYGMFDVNNRFCMDYELLLRSYHNFPSVKMKNIVVAAWRDGGIGTDKTIEILREYQNIKIKNRISNTIIIKAIFIVNVLMYKFKKSIKKVHNKW